MSILLRILFLVIYFFHNFSVAAHFMSKFTAETVKKNHKTRLKCEAIGDKPISITWMKDKVNIKPESDPR